MASKTPHQTVTSPARPKGFALLAAALQTRKAACMLGLGFSSGLPFALLIGTLNAWLGEVGIKLATIGVLSWIGLAYSFKFLWSPLVDRVPLPLLERMGRRRGWILLCQIILALGFLGLAATDPRLAIGNFALIAFVAAFASSTQDIVIDAWRIDVADDDTPLELLTALGQFGYRTASIVGGALTLIMASWMSWPHVYMVMAVVMALVALASLAAPDTPRPETHGLHASLGSAGEVEPRVRAVLLFAVLASWTWAIVAVVSFMVRVLAPLAPGAKAPSVADFTKIQGPWIVVATVAVPFVAAALANSLKTRGRGVLASDDGLPTPIRAAANHVWSALIAPLAELVARLGWGVFVLMGFILTYALAYNIWSSFAFPFYLGALHYSKDQVAFASKVFGIFMTMGGIGLAGYLFARIGMFPTVALGSVLPALGNLLYADLADGGARIDQAAVVLRLPAIVNGMGIAFANAVHSLPFLRYLGFCGFTYDPRMSRLLLAIAYENVATGFALTAFVAYLSSIVSKRYTAIQYALLSALTFLVGTLGRGVVGEAFDHYGYAPVFRWTALAGVVSLTFVLAEWARATRSNPEIPR